MRGNEWISSLVILAIAVVALTAVVPPQEASAAETGQHGYRYEISDEGALFDHLNYLLFLPESYGQNPDEKWPLILFLHGSLERVSNFL